MLLRSAVQTDLDACFSLDADLQTDHVWQMEEREENGGLLVRFQTVRLPRVMRVSYPRLRDDLLSCWENGSVVLVATDKRTVDPDQDQTTVIPDAEPASIYAYCQLDACAWQQAGWISHMIVDRRYRRQGIGTAMVRASVLWGKKRGLRRLMVALQTKNYPGICFCEKHGFVFSGFNDHYYTNGDIALFFTLRI
jgi:GNAT superfamily N-acetyltransferase